MAKKCQKYLCGVCEKEYDKEVNADYCCALRKLARELFNQKVEYPKRDEATIDITIHGVPRLTYKYYKDWHAEHLSYIIWHYRNNEWVLRS